MYHLDGHNQYMYHVHCHNLYMYHVHCITAHRQLCLSKLYKLVDDKQHQWQEDQSERTEA